MSARAVAAFATVLVLGAAMVWAGAGPFPGEDCFADVPAESWSVDSDTALVPPGKTDCVATSPAGQVATSSYVPWAEWGAVVAFALAAALAVSALRAEQRRRLLVAVAGLAALAFMLTFGLV